jgi:hypothetical protein
MVSIADKARGKLLGLKMERTTLGDAEIRRWAYKTIFGPRSLVIDEFGIAGGKARADIAVIMSHRLSGIEIKSDLDTIKRLANQSLHYTQFFDRCGIIIGHKFVNHALQVLPPEWEVVVLTKDLRGNIKGNLVRPARQNEVNYYNWLALLWREEVLNHFRADASHANLTRVTKDTLLDVWKERHGPDETKKIVLDILIHRKDWRRRDPGTIHRF